MSTVPTFSLFEAQSPDTRVQPMAFVSSLPSTLVRDKSVLGKSLVIRGEITGSESLVVLGQFQGSIELPGAYVHVGPDAVVSSDVAAREIVICGDLQGNLCADERVDIRNGASMAGDVVAKRISIEDGAFFKGTIDMPSSEPKPEPQPSAAVPNATPTTANGNT
jgi:cytoskeletal protein CcmA (bactofilin family)